jgi:MerR family transcriptional regulator/heat shock protein HspR
MPRGRRTPAETSKPGAGGARYYMISVVSKLYGIHPQTLRLYEREGLLKPSRTEGNTRLYSEDDLRQLEVILNLTRDLGVNLAGVEIVLNMRRRMEQVQQEVNEFVAWVGEELARAAPDGWQERLQEALVRLPPTPLARAAARAARADDAARAQDVESRPKQDAESGPARANETGAAGGER